MKILSIIFSCILLIISCTTIKTPEKQTNSDEKSMKFETDEDGEYDIIVFDPQYETYLISIAKPKEYYSEQFYKTKNILYVTEWNIRHNQPFTFDPDLYTVRIDYESSKDYGLNLEYKLYNFFQFIEWKYKVRF